MECCRSSHQTAAPATHHLPLNQMLFAFELSLTELSLIVHVPGTGVIQVEIDDLLKLMAQFWIFDRGYRFNSSV